MIQELKAFLLRGDVVTLAVAVVIGTAFGKIVDAFTKGIIEPLLAKLGTDDSAVTLKIDTFDLGLIISSIVNFLIVGIVLFFVIKAAGKKAEDVK
jgi:large conductance mechanosensitive channel